MNISAVGVIEVTYILIALAGLFRSTHLRKLARRYEEAREREGKNGTLKLLIRKRQVRYTTITAMLALNILIGLLFFSLPGTPQGWHDALRILAFFMLAVQPLMLYGYLEYDNRTEVIVERSVAQHEPIQAQAKSWEVKE